MTNYKDKVTKGPVTLDDYGSVMSNDDGLLIEGVGIPFGIHPQREEAEANRDLFVDALNVFHETGMTPRELAELVERLRLEAQMHAQEARTANATIAEIYQVCTGSTGEPGNWNGAEPVRRMAEQRADLLRLASRAEVAFNTVRYCYEHNPGNFAVAMQELDADVAPLREVIAKCKGNTE